MNKKQRQLLASVLQRLERREYIEWIAQDETEGTDEYYWVFGRSGDSIMHIEDFEYKKLLALTRPRRRKRKNG